jgi:diacylglycerol kinase (ATP)
MPLRQWLKSANFAIEGILHAAKTQRHLRYHLYAAAFVLLLSYAVGVSRMEFLIIALAVIAVLFAEMLNTAVEAMVDLLSPEHNETAKTAKDVAAGAVLITAMGSVIIGFIVLYPYVRDLFHEGLSIAKHSREEIAVIAFVLVLIVVVLLKSHFGKGHPLSGGMPSGHAAFAFSLWVAVTYTTESFIASLLSLILALLIAQSRVTTKVHRAREVILGGLIGASLTFLLFQIFT